ncbi:FAD-dependent oxidoreductase [uncultured Clostridium sp.]|uniref:NAD(P)/FAD-dependent oxidoreductase n=1 Tax=uncultured Clostridium sp. TaxID=59620 RepID=UPI002608FBA0|nr:FAD-dependent oxidoreductase [uncultured Clostridium sp.]
MKEYDLVIIGAGISGMTAAIGALSAGISNVLILEREEIYGGVLNQCIHCGFTINEEKVTGPEVIGFISDKLAEYQYELKLKTTVLEASEEKIVTYINEEDGINSVKTKSLIVSTGCRERYTGSVLIPTSKFTGVFTIGNAHNIINLDGALPGKYPVIIANNKWALILARRIELEGGEVVALIVNAESKYKISDEDREIIEGIDMPVIERGKLTEVAGGKRVSNIKVIDLDSFEEKVFDCDSLLLSVGYYPEISMLEQIDIELLKDEKALKVDGVRTSKEWIFACGNVIPGNEYKESRKLGGYGAGLQAAEYLESLK